MRRWTASSFPGSPDEIEVTAIVLHSELEATGSFECGQPKVNQLYSNICWGQRDNFFEVPTDCPQRDERLGWTGDAEVFCAAAAFNMNVASFFRKWLRDQREAQFENGSGTISRRISSNREWRVRRMGRCPRNLPVDNVSALR